MLRFRVPQATLSSIKATYPTIFRLSTPNHCLPSIAPLRTLKIAVQYLHYQPPINFLIKLVAAKQGRRLGRVKIAVQNPESLGLRSQGPRSQSPRSPTVYGWVRMANLQFRVATPDDAPQLQRLIQAAFRAEDSRKDWVGDAELAANFCIGVDEILPKITSPDSEMIMAFDDNGALAGTVGVFRRNDDLARLFYLAVDQTLHRGGVGRQVLEYAEGYCQRTWGVKKLGLDALTLRKELIAWYMRRGYVPTGDITPFPLDKLNGRALPEGLGFVEMEKEAKAEA